MSDQSEIDSIEVVGEPDPIEIKGKLTNKFRLVVNEFNGKLVSYIAQGAPVEGANTGVQFFEDSDGVFVTDCSPELDVSMFWIDPNGKTVVELQKWSDSAWVWHSRITMKAFRLQPRDESELVLLSLPNEGGGMDVGVHRPSRFVEEVGIKTIYFTHATKSKAVC